MSKTPSRWPALLALISLLAPAPTAAAEPRPPELLIEGPDSHTGMVELLRGLDPDALLPMVELLGLDDPGPPIRVVVAAEGSEAARRAPSWGVAYAIGPAGLIVLLAGRVPVYPDRDLENVLHHEVAHILISRAARRHPVPRWFNEGLAIYAARPWGLDDRSRLVWATVRRGGASLAELDRGFQAGSYRAARAYALAAAFVRYLVERHGPEVAARVLAGVGDGLAFDHAFRRATGVSLAVAEDRFWRHLDLWNKWVPFLTSSATLWMAISALALLAFKRRRDRDAEQRARWDEEDRLQETPTDGWVH